jgi:hypothetical protein
MNFINGCYQRFYVKIELKTLKLAGTNKIISKDANHRQLSIFAFILFLSRWFAFLVVVWRRTYS